MTVYTVWTPFETLFYVKKCINLWTLAGMIPSGFVIMWEKCECIFFLKDPVEMNGSANWDGGDWLEIPVLTLDGYQEISSWQGSWPVRLGQSWELFKQLGVGWGENLRSVPECGDVLWTNESRKSAVIQPPPNDVLFRQITCRALFASLLSFCVNKGSCDGDTCPGDTSILDYCNALSVGLPLETIWKLKHVKNEGGRKRRYDSVTPILQELHWLPISFHVQQVCSVSLSLDTHVR